LVSAPPDPLIGAIVDGRWRVTERLGRGGMGTVYRGERIKLGKSVALKFLDEGFARSKPGLARFDREARAISRLHHAHCVSIIDFGVHHGRPFIVMEYVAGKPLGRVMGTPEMTPARAAQIMRQMLDVLRHAHAHGVVHRDLKPDNVMLAEVTGNADFVKILDFGLARIISVDEPSISLPAVVAGTPSWMSPEQAAGKKVDHRSDLFSAGAILYGMCTGRKPFRGDDLNDVMRQVRDAKPIPPRKLAPTLSEGLERVILKAMAASADDRYYTAADFLSALEATREAKALERRRPGRRRAAVMLVALAMGGGAYAARDRLARWLDEGRARLGERRRTSSPTSTSPRARREPAPLEATPMEPALAREHEVATPNPKPGPTLAAPTAAVATVDPVRARIDELIDADKLVEAEKALRAVLPAQRGAAWPRLLLGEVYFRRLWRADASAAFEEALRLDPELRHDRRLGDRLCVALGPKWKGEGARILSARFADELVPTLERCLVAVDDYPRLQAVARELERAAGRAKVDHVLVAVRTVELAHDCADRRAAVRVLARASDPRAAETLDRLRGDGCLRPAIPPSLDPQR
jgi:serine/threonine-protein kinase